MSTKGNARSFRYSDEVAGILEAFEGGSLNAKFENFVLYCFWNRKKIDEQLVQKRKEYDELCKQVSGKRADLMELDSLMGDKKRLSSVMTHLALEVVAYHERLSKSVTQSPLKVPGEDPANCVTEGQRASC